MLKLSSSRGIRIDIPVLSVSWSLEDHSVNIQALRKGLIEHEASDTGGVPRWKSSCPDRLAEATGQKGFLPKPSRDGRAYPRASLSKKCTWSHPTFDLVHPLYTRAKINVDGWEEPRENDTRCRF